MKRIIFCLLICSQILAQDLTSDLVICMPMDGNANDLSGNNNHGVVSAAILTADRFGNSNSAYHFNGTNSYISVVNNNSLAEIEANDELTISAWCKVSAWYQNYNVFSIVNKYNTVSDYGWDFNLQNSSTNGIMFIPNYPQNSNQYTFTANNSMVFNQWHFYAISFSKSNQQCKLFKDGVLLNTVNTNSLSLENTNSYLYIGYSPAGPNEFSNGDIDDLKLFSRALTELEIQTLYNNSSSCTAASIKESQTSISAFYLLNNPTTDHVNIICKDENTNLGDITIIVYSNDGKIVKEESFPSGQNEFNVNVQDLSSGFYHINVSDKKHSQNLKFIKN